VQSLGALPKATPSGSDQEVKDIPSHGMSIQDQERRLVILALRIASTYCHVAESHVRARHRADTQRVLQKARKEVDAVEFRLRTNVGLFGNQTDTVLEQVAELKERVKTLERLAA
jgi:hypothetical protein